MVLRPGRVPRRPSPAHSLTPRVRGLQRSATIAINDRCRELQARGKDIFKLGLGQSPFPVPDSVQRELQDNAHRKAYLPVEGLPELREAIASHHREEFGIRCSADDVMVGPGSKELLFLLQLVYEGEIVIPSPSWVSYAPQARIIGRSIRILSTNARDGWRMTPDQLAAHCRFAPNRPRIIILNYPSNPTGLTYPPDLLEEIAEVAARYRALVLSDEIYGRLHHEGRHVSIVPSYPQGTVFSGGLSKWCGAGGWRLGLFVVPERMRWLLRGIAAVASETFTSTSAPIQYAAVRAFSGGDDLDAYLAACRRIFKALGMRIAAMLRDAGVFVLDPEGAFYLFPDFSPLAEPLRAAGITTAGELCEALLLETGVALLPGIEFGRPGKELTARLAYVNFGGKAALDGLNALPPGVPVDDAFLETWCGRTMEATRRICDWLRDKTRS